MNYSHYFLFKTIIRYLNTGIPKLFINIFIYFKMHFKSRILAIYFWATTIFILWQRVCTNLHLIRVPALRTLANRHDSEPSSDSASWHRSSRAKRAECSDSQQDNTCKVVSIFFTDIIYHFNNFFLIAMNNLKNTYRKFIILYVFF